MIKYIINFLMKLLIYKYYQFVYLKNLKHYKKKTLDIFRG